MKELNIEEKAKAYDETIERADKLRYVSDKDSSQCKTVEHIFPELKKFENDEIKKWLIGYFNQYIIDGMPQVFGNGLNVKDVIAWLEKQGDKDKFIEKELGLIKGYRENAIKRLGELEKQAEKKPCGQRQECFNCQFNYAGECKGSCAMKIGEQKPSDNIEPKFNVGDWVVSPNGVYWHIDAIRDGRYQVSSNSGYIADWPLNTSIYHRFTIQDAKDGDVLCCESGWTCLFKAFNSDISFSSYCFMDSTGWFCETGSESHTLEKAFIKAYNGNIYPATKEHRELLFKKMHEAGYTFDFDKKELKKIEQKPAWSEEDDMMIEETLYFLREYQQSNRCKDESGMQNSVTCEKWLKSLKERIGG